MPFYEPMPTLARSGLYVKITTPRRSDRLSLFAADGAPKRSLELSGVGMNRWLTITFMVVLVFSRSGSACAGKPLIETGVHVGAIPPVSPTGHGNPPRKRGAAIFPGLLFWNASPVNQNSTEAVLFDVPALLEARELHRENQLRLPNHKLIVVTIPVTSEIRADDKGNVNAFRFDAYWNKNPFPISDYAPKTQTVSEIAGTIAIDKSRDDSSGFDLKVNSAWPPVAAGIGQANRSKHESTKHSYEEIPQHEILVASGTVRRGTGAFFRFHPSRSETLEGGRELTLTFRVPPSWRGGVLQVECTAIGKRRVFGWQEPFEVQRAFIVPVYIENDEEAENSAMEFVVGEQKLRQSWNQFRSQAKSTSSSNHPFEHLFGTSSRSSRQSPSPTLTEDWLNSLIQTSDQPLNQVRLQLPTELEAAADRFVESRANLLKFSR